MSKQNELFSLGLLSVCPMSLTLIMGSMYSGKTTALIKQVQDLRQLGLKCLLVNHQNDSRAEGQAVRTHDGQRCVAVKTATLEGVGTMGYDVIAIDEGQFFSNLKAVVMHMVEHKGLHVVVAGLNGDYLRRPFGEMLDLVPMADQVEWLRAQCGECEGRAAFTKRVSDETAKVSVKSRYTPVCRMCYITAK